MPAAIPLAMVGGSIGGALIGSHGASSAASAQANAANYAAGLQHQDAQDALNFQKQQWQTSQNNLAPWLDVGRSGLANLAYQLGIMPGGPGGTGAIGGLFGGGSNSLAHNPMARTMQGSGDQAPQTMTMMPGGWGDADPGLLNAGYRNDGGEVPGRIARMTNTMPDDGQIIPPSPSAPAAPDTSLNSLVNPGLGGYGSLSQGWNQQFQAPTDVTEQNDPGYKFRLQQGLDAIQRSAAAKGNLLTGGTAKDINDYAQNDASNEYGNVYNRAFNQYATNYNQFEQNQTNSFNRLAAMAGIGQTSAQQLGMLGQNAASNVGNIDLVSGQQIGNNINNAGAARASGYVGGANAWGGALSGMGNNLSTLMMMQKLMGGSGGGSGVAPGWDMTL